VLSTSNGDLNGVAQREHLQSLEPRAAMEVSVVLPRQLRQVGEHCSHEGSRRLRRVVVGVLVSKIALSLPLFQWLFRAFLIGAVVGVSTWRSTTESLTKSREVRAHTTEPTDIEFCHKACREPRWLVPKIPAAQPPLW